MSPKVNLKPGSYIRPLFQAQTEVVSTNEYKQRIIENSRVYEGETSRNSAAHWRHVRKRSIGAGPCVSKEKWAWLLAPFSFGREKENENQA